MARYSGKRAVSDETREEALRIARGTRQPGQTKEQTKLITQGIQKGIDLYKKQQKAKQRDVSRRLRKAGQAADSSSDAGEAPDQLDGDDGDQGAAPRGVWLPWSLLVLTWAGVAMAIATGRLVLV